MGAKTPTEDADAEVVSAWIHVQALARGIAQQETVRYVLGSLVEAVNAVPARVATLRGRMRVCHATSRRATWSDSILRRGAP